MTTTAPSPARPRQGDLRLTQRRVVVSEWVKLRSLRSTVYTLVAAVIVIIGFGLLASAAVSGQLEGPPGGGQGAPGGGFPVDATMISLAGVQLAQIIIGVLGVLVISGEYATGMIRSSLTAVPRRLPVLWGKAIVLSAVTVALMLVAVLVAFFAGQAILAGKDMDVALTDDGVLRAVVGSALYLTGIGVIGIALGALLRHTAGAITTLFAVLLVVPGLLGLVLPDSWADAIAPYLPAAAGQAFTAVADTGQGLLGPGAGFAVFIGSVAVLLVAAAVALTRRDA
ncbi:ABC-type transport system involved in multi-copper enzyme maturation permease subunit [Blastococcus colisei]|uniref:ABC-type transport system involved in multi-copper enzyme maturation permease subunit n=1 Tax=Blastococcus colisei TaxID=1564162 RepID=A0A543PJ96_9ACTN|nr:ABC transporter permease subunit [Blastococcus colisei]TQN44153.1 ABC-type transport system involved in multi-copper enzyme maturation permease subunit [Blastococcus colisei]